MPSISSHYDTEEKTEPFPSSEYASRIHALRAQQQQDASLSTIDANAASSTDALGNTISNIHLDELVVPSDKDIRLLVRPLRSRSVSPGNLDSCEWVALRSERTDLVGETDESDFTTAPAETVLAVTQTSKDIKFTVHMPGEHHIDGTPIPPLWCELYYDPASDNQILVNRCDVPISLFRVYPSYSPLLSSSSLSSPPSSSDGTPMTPGTPVQDDIEHAINPDMTRALSPGTWRIKIEDVEVLDFRILERRRTFFKALPPPPPAADSQGTTSSGKRSFALVVDGEDDAEEGPEARRQKVTNTDTNTPMSPNSKESIVMFIRPTADPFVFPLPNPGTGKGKELGAVAAPGSHALLEMRAQDTAVVQGRHDTDNYALTKRDDIASTSLSTVFTGFVDDHPDVPSGSVVTVKVIKTRTIAPLRSPSPARERERERAAAAAAVAAGQMRPRELERIAVRQADTWQREVESHGYLRHNSIVRLYGADARYLSLYMEHVDAMDLSKRNAWRLEKTDYFMGDRRDAMRILRDISGALHYIHNLNVVHNDVKPANILYSRERGAVLCDFGLSTKSASQPSAGGTPYYVPPEFIGRKLRGPPSDVWALGITMLYVLRKIAFPDTRGARHRPNPLYWMIAEVNNKSSSTSLAPPRGGSVPTSTLPAVMQMQMWLSEINEAKETLNRDNKIERLTYEMLTPNRNQRITMKSVVHELFAEGG